MRLNENLQLASDRLIQSLYDFLIPAARKINGLASGSYSSRDNQRTAAPTTGTWAQGDFVENSNATELGVALAKYIIVGWRCTVGGPPGTFVFVECRFLTGA